MDRAQAISPPSGNHIFVAPDLRICALDTGHSSLLAQLHSSRVVGEIPASPHSRLPSLVLRAATLPPFRSILRSLPRTSLLKTRPIHLVELCGGICAFLEAFLRNGYEVTRYTFCDRDLMARAAARHRLWLLHSRYPRLFPCTAFASWDTSLPHDFHAIGERHWAALPTVDVIASGPPCQSFSAA